MQVCCFRCYVCQIEIYHFSCQRRSIYISISAQGFSEKRITHPINGKLLNPYFLGGRGPTTNPDFSLTKRYFSPSFPTTRRVQDTWGRYDTSWRATHGCLLSWRLPRFTLVRTFTNITLHNPLSTMIFYEGQGVSQTIER